MCARSRRGSSIFKAVSLAALLVLGVLFSSIFGCSGQPQPCQSWASDIVRPDGAALEWSRSPDRPVLLVFCNPAGVPSRRLLAELPALADKCRVVAVLIQAQQGGTFDSIPGVESAVPKTRELLKRMRIETLPTSILLDRIGRELVRYDGYGLDVRGLISARLDSLAVQP